MLLESEVKRCRDELGYNVLAIGAEPYITTSAVFNQVIKLYTIGSAQSTSVSLITAAPPRVGPQLTTITLVDATGFFTGDNVAVDIDARYEQGRIEQITGNVITLQLAQAHGDVGGASYPVTQEGAEMIVREKLRNIAYVKSRILKATTQAGLKQADEIQWYEGKQGLGGPIAGQMALLDFWREELASTLGVQNLRALRGAAGGNTSPVLY